MTDKYPMAIYPPKGEMIIVNDEKEHADALASWAPVVVEPVAPVEPAAPVEPVEPVAQVGPVVDPETVGVDDEPDTFDDAGVPVKRGPGRPRKVIP